MRRKPRLLFSFLFILGALSTTTVILHGCAPARTAELFVSQEDGHVLVSSDGGRSWSTHLVGTNTALFDISVTDTRTVWVAGQSYTSDEGVIFKSLSGGESWARVYSGRNQYLRGISAPGGGTVWAGGGKNPLDPDLYKTINMLIVPHPLVIKTTDGERKWVDETPKAITAGEIHKIFAYDSRNAAAAAAEGIWTTGNGGKTWRNVLSENKIIPEDLSSSDINNVWVAGQEPGLDQSLVYRTSNGGKTWSGHRFAKGVYIRSVCAVSGSTAWAAGSNGAIFKTTDGGATWARQDSKTKRSLGSISAGDSENVCAVGAAGTIVITTDGGKTWRKQFAQNKSDLFGVSMIMSE